MSNFTIQLIEKLLLLPGLLIAISAHEFAHAYAAYRLGDNSQRFQGRLTLNPIKHIDPIGFLLLMVIGFGWAKPVMIDSRKFKNPRKDDTIVSLAGPLANFILALVFTILTGITYVIMYKTGTSQTLYLVLEIFKLAIQINLVLMVFNLIPIPPLDGHHLLGNIFGAKVWNFYYRFADIWRFVLIALIVLGGTSFIISPIVGGIYSFLIKILNNILLLVL